MVTKLVQRLPGRGVNVLVVRLLADRLDLFTFRILVLDAYWLSCYDYYRQNRYRSAQPTSAFLEYCPYNGLK